MGKKHIRWQSAALAALVLAVCLMGAISGVTAQETLQIDTDTLVRIATSQETLLAFTPATTSLYTLFSMGDVDTVGRLYDANKKLLTQNDDSVGMGLNFKIEYVLLAGKTYYYGVSCFEKGWAGDVAVRLTVADRLELDKPYSISAAGAEEKFFCFVPGESAMYRYYSSWEYDDDEASASGQNKLFCVFPSQSAPYRDYSSGETYGEIYDSEMSSIYSEATYIDGNFSLVSGLQAGVPYVFSVSSNNAAEFDICVSKEFSAENMGAAATLTAGTPAKLSFNSGGETKYYKIASPSVLSDFTLMFSSNSHTRLKVFNAEYKLCSQDFGYYGECDFTMKTGDQYFVRVTLSGAKDTGVVILNLTSFDTYAKNAEKLTLYTDYNVDLPQYERYAFFKFSPETSGRYVASLLGDHEADVQLFDADGNYINTYYHKARYLEKGMDYYYSVYYYYYGDRTGAVFNLGMLADANCDGGVNIDDILFLRDVIFGKEQLTPQGRNLLRLYEDDTVDVDAIMFIRNVLFGNYDYGYGYG